MPEEEGSRAGIVIADSGWTRVRLEVGRARRYTDLLETLIDSGLVAHFLGSEGGVNAILRADSARIDDKTGNMCAYGNVSVYSERNRTLVLSNLLCYEKEEGRLFSDESVAVHDTLRGRYLTGTGFECDDALREYTFYNVTGQATSLPD
jgi:lipopolysaccharide assembly outer membrane protein LptD (OstA)